MTMHDICMHPLFVRFEQLAPFRYRLTWLDSGLERSVEGSGGQVLLAAGNAMLAHDRVLATRRLRELAEAAS